MRGLSCERATSCCHEATEVKAIDVTADSNSEMMVTEIIHDAPGLRGHEIDKIYEIEIAEKEDGQDFFPLAENGAEEPDEEDVRIEDDAAEKHRSSQQLSLYIQSDLLNAVDLDHCLAGCGKHWHGTLGGLQSGHFATYRNYVKKVNKYDEFISHDWATDGRLKFLCLCLHYNKVMATFAAVIVGAIFGALELFYPELRRMASLGNTIGGVRYTVDSVGYFGLEMGLFAYCAVFFFGQRIRKLLFRPRSVFMDKLCIDQEDAGRKSQGILGLGGFLQVSDRLLVLWSPRYFTRLWCVFELAAWHTIGKPVEDIVLAPVAQSAFIILLMVGMSFLMVVLVWIARLSNFEYAAAVAIAVGVVIPLPFHLMRRFSRDLRRIPEQVKSFDFEDASCFCCSVNHTLPGTDEQVTCDRTLVAHQVGEWFKGDESGRSASDCFNDFVRTTLGRHIQKQMVGGKGKYSLSCMACLPGVLFLTDRFHLIYSVDRLDHQLRLIVHYLAVAFFVFPGMVRLSLHIADRVDTYFTRRESRVHNLMITMVASAGVSFGILSSMSCLSYSVQIESPWPQIASVIVALMVVAGLYRQDIRSVVHRD
mmetsp:Transcript_64599/g.114911  ORF Transcript_64599/g.114911 Transcript_64599/m.114911 type:complete len:591 (+) Transcript_64599:87-1859(+)